ncbi:ComEA family DNA-binding protein [Kribbella sp. NBC_00889]|uniref:ComEA family DNA-binding protein n=1 Tax=Kribbella sp. NBC_00889 TaxID=2975974 RepID=UPI00386C44F6|nr:helix-hairpin-helix domain-containing protein [Kribbella sp. NBC_00889]
MRAPRTNWKTVWLKLAGAAVPLVTIGVGSPIMFGILAVRRRSLLLAVSALVYLGTAVAFWVPGWGEPDHPSPDAVVLVLLASMGVATIQAALVIGGRKYGGLVDLNEASVEVLSALPELDRQRATAIVSSRTQTGRFRSVDELWSRGLLSGPPSKDLVDRLVVVPVQDRR